VSPLEDILGQRLLGLLQQQLHFLRADLQKVDNSTINRRIHVYTTDFCDSFSTPKGEPNPKRRIIKRG
jgi:hypothetical protein